MCIIQLLINYLLSYIKLVNSAAKVRQAREVKEKQMLLNMSFKYQFERERLEIGKQFELQTFNNLTCDFQVIFMCESVYVSLSLNMENIIINNVLSKKNHYHEPYDIKPVSKRMRYISYS